MEAKRIEERVEYDLEMMRELGYRITSYNVCYTKLLRIIRLFMAMILYSVFSYFFRGRFFPSDASAFNWTWLIISGLVGFVFGDFFLFKSYEFMSVRISMLIMSLSPPFAAIISWFALGETLSAKAILAMAVTIFGIMVVITRITSYNVCYTKLLRLSIKFCQ